MFRLGYCCLFMVLYGVAIMGYTALTQRQYQELVGVYAELTQDPTTALVKVLALQRQLKGESWETQVKISFLLVEIYQKLTRTPEAIMTLQTIRQRLPVSHPQRLTIELGLMQLYYQMQDYKQCIQQGESLLIPAQNWGENSKKASTALLLGYCYYHQKHYSQALAWSQQANIWENQPPEAWLRFTLSLYQHLQQWENVANFIEQHLLLRFPQEKIYWQSLLASYLQLKNYSQALAVMELMPAYIAFDTTLHMQQVYLYRRVQMPAQAARYLQNNLEIGAVPVERVHMLLLIELWIEARDRPAAMQQLARLLEERDWASPQQQGEALLQQASLALQQGNWLQLKMSLLQAKQYLLELNEYWTIWLARSFIEQEEWQAASALLKRVAKQYASAQAWLDYIHFLKPCKLSD